MAALLCDTLNLLSFHKFIGLECEWRQGYCRLLCLQRPNQDAELLPALPEVCLWEHLEIMRKATHALGLHFCVICAYQSCARMQHLHCLQKQIPGCSLKIYDALDALVHSTQQLTSRWRSSLENGFPRRSNSMRSAAAPPFRASNSACAGLACCQHNQPDRRNTVNRAGCLE